jgi:hypothetical protein
VNTSTKLDPPEICPGHCNGGPDAIPLSFKPSKFSKKPSWRTVETGHVTDLVAGLPLPELADGRVGVWLTAWSETPAGRVVLPWLDIEASGKAHGRVADNIRVAVKLFLHLAEHGLDDGLVVALTGSGFRFCWPFAVEPELAQAFMAMARDSADWPGIDAAPLTGSASPLLLWAYRGPSPQGGKGDRHIHFLDHPGQLLDLTPGEYERLVKGQPDPAKAFRDIARIVPRSWTPPTWRPILEHYQHELELRRCVIRVNFPAREKVRVIDMQAVLDHLHGLGITTRELTVGEQAVHRLSRCPSCGEAWGNPWVTSGGWLKCHRAGCEAGQITVDLQGKEFRRGLSLRQWAPELSPNNEVVEPEFHQPPRETIPLDVARQTIREALAGDEPALLLKIPAGVGKSHAGVEHALEVAQDGVVLLTVPTTALAEELAAKARQMALELGQDVDVRQYRGRTKETCQQADYCVHVASMGFSPALLVCSKCMSRETCSHFHQLEGLEHGLVIAAHAAAPFVLPKIKRGLREWIVDESPLRDLMRQETVYQGSFTALKARLVGQAETALVKIEATAERLLGKVASENGGAHGRLYATTPPSGEWEATMSLWAAAGITEPEREALSSQLAYFDQHQDEKPGKWQRRLWDEKVDLAMLRWMWLGLDETAQGSTYIRCQPDPKSPITFRSLRNIVPDLPDNVRLVALDATGDHRELEALFSRPFKVVDAAVELPPARRVWLRVGMGKRKVNRLMDDQAKLEALFRKGMANLRPEDKHVLLITHQSAEVALLELARRVDPSREWASTHYWSSRGLDCWRDYDAALAFGTPTANRAGVLDLELALFGGDQAARDTWFSGLGPRDLIQAMNRVRPVMASKTLIIIGREWPAELGKPSFVIDMQRHGGQANVEEQAYERLLVLARHFGFMFPELAHVAGVFRAEDQANEHDWHERIEPLLTGETPFAIAPTLIRDILIRVRAMEEGLSPIRLGHRGHAWPRLMARLENELGLLSLEYHPRTAHGGGRSQAAVGFVSAVRHFCEKYGMTFDQSLWKGQEEPLTIPSATATGTAIIRVEAHGTARVYVLPPKRSDKPASRRDPLLQPTGRRPRGLGLVSFLPPPRAIPWVSTFDGLHLQPPPVQATVAAINV